VSFTDDLSQPFGVSVSGGDASVSIGSTILAGATPSSSYVPADGRILPWTPERAKAFPYAGYEKTVGGTRLIQRGATDSGSKILLVNGTTTGYYSSDYGDTYIPVTLPVSATTVTYGFGVWVVSTSNGPPQWAPSPDGSWSVGTGIFTNWSNCADLEFLNDRIIASSNSGYAFYSLDGKAWVQYATHSLSLYVGPWAYGNGLFVSAPVAGTNYGNYTSSDGVNLNRRVPVAAQSFPDSIAYGGGFFYALNVSTKSALVIGFIAEGSVASNTSWSTFAAPSSVDGGSSAYEIDTMWWSTILNRLMIALVNMANGVTVVFSSGDRSTWREEYRFVPPLTNALGNSSGTRMRKATGFRDRTIFSSARGGRIIQAPRKGISIAVPSTLRQDGRKSWNSSPLCEDSLGGRGQ
jgi:hypothetical protein